MVNEKRFVCKELELKQAKVLEIEDIQGNTLGSINLYTGEYIGDFDFADVDGDYLFDSGSELVRIQLNNKV